MLKKMYKIASFYFFILVVDFLGGFFKGISFVAKMTILFMICV